MNLSPASIDYTEWAACPLPAVVHFVAPGTARRFRELAADAVAKVAIVSRTRKSNPATDLVGNEDLRQREIVWRSRARYFIKQAELAEVMIEWPELPKHSRAPQPPRVYRGSPRRTPQEINDRLWSALQMRHHGSTYREIGKSLGVSVERARQIVSKAMRTFKMPWRDRTTLSRLATERQHVMDALAALAT